MVRFFLENPPVEGEAVLEGEERHHLVNVYRGQPGIKIKLFDKEGKEYLAEIISVTSKLARLRILEISFPLEAQEKKIFLAQSLIKSQNWDLLLQKSMELGLYGLYPMLTQHLGNGKQMAGKEERWQKVMISAAKQCGRTSLIQIASTMDFSEVLKKTASFPTRLLAHNAKGLPSFKNLLDRLSPISYPVLVMIGPEGGFSEEEIHQAHESGILMFSLGNLILKAETAAIAVIANLNFYKG